MNDEKTNNTVLIVFLILLNMGVILFCSYLIYRQNVILTKETEKTEHCIEKKYKFNNFNSRESDQIIYGIGDNIFRKAILYKEGNICISYKRKNEELNENCIVLNKPVYMHAVERNEKTHLYIIMDNGTITEISFNNNFDTNVIEEYLKLKNIIRIYTESNDNIPVFVDYNGKEYKYAG